MGVGEIELGVVVGVNEWVDVCEGSAVLHVYVNTHKHPTPRTHTMMYTLGYY